MPLAAAHPKQVVRVERRDAHEQQQQLDGKDPTSNPSGSNWTDFSSSWNAFGNTASSWWEFAASSWQPETPSTSASTPNSDGGFFSNFSFDSQYSPGDLAQTKRRANGQSLGNGVHPYHHSQRSKVMRKELSKLSGQTLPSDFSSEDWSLKDECVWSNQRGNRISGSKHSRGFAFVNEGEGEEVGISKSSNAGGCCRNFREKSLKYKLVVFVLIAIIIACSFVILLTSLDIYQFKKAQNSQTANTNVDLANSAGPTGSPTMAATNTPTTLAPTTSAPTMATLPPTENVRWVTYIPGKLTVRSNGLLLSQGLRSRIVANSGEPVILDGLPPMQTSISKQSQSPPIYYTSAQPFHGEPDGAAVFPWAETGGWVYVSNSEIKEQGGGGVGAIYFDKNGNVMDYQRLLDGTTMNCGGGPTPWGTWVTCEETKGGKAYQVDPFGIRPPETLTMIDNGFFEAFAHDIRDPRNPAFFITEDKERGPLRRMIPRDPDWEDPWDILHGLGTLEYLVLEPNLDDNNNTGTYYWTTNWETGKVNSKLHYRNSEGIDVHNDQLFFVSKEQKELFILNLDDMTYEKHTTVSGVFDGHPDQMKRLIHNGLLYFCEEGGKENGVHARDENGWFFSILESDTLSDETTGLAFSPDGMHMYISYQHNGIIFDVWREDGLPFHGRTLNVKYHEIYRR